MADISKLKPVERVVEITNPGDETQNIGIRVCVMALSDPRMKTIKRKIQDEKLRKEARGKSLKAEEIEDNQNELLFGAMTSWEWYNPTGQAGDKNFDKEADMFYNGKKPAFDKPTVFAVLTEFPWFADQVAEAIAAEKDFF